MRLAGGSAAGAVIRRGAGLTLALAAAALAAVALPPAASARADGLPELTCSDHTLPVRIADPGPADQTMWGQLCYRGSREPATVQLLVHGATYNHLYWNFPYGGGYYSYVEAATAAGYATFDIDRIGDGYSSHPPSAELDLTAGAVALHDAVTALRAGTVNGHPFQHVIMVGHSLGSVEAWIEAASYHDVNAVIIRAPSMRSTPTCSLLPRQMCTPRSTTRSSLAPASTPATQPPGPAHARHCSTIRPRPTPPWSPWMRQTRTQVPSASSAACYHSRASLRPSSLPARSTFPSWLSWAPMTTSSAPASPLTTAQAPHRSAVTKRSTTSPPRT